MPENSKPLSIILVSYVPFLVGEPGTSFLLDDATLLDISNTMETLPSGQAMACIWAQRDRDVAKVSPILLYDHAFDLLDHLTAWSEGKPIDWFNLYLMEKDGKYSFALIPNLDKSSERYNISFQLQHGYPLPKDAKLNFLFKPIYFVSGANHTFDNVRHLVGDTIEIGFMDVSKIDPNNIRESFQKTDDSDIRWLGPFKLSSNSVMTPFLNNLLDNAKEP